MRHLHLLGLWLLMPSLVAHAQSAVTLEKVVSGVKVDTSYTLIGRVIESTIRVSRADTILSNRHWRYDALNSAWILTSAEIAGSDLKITYATYPWFRYRELPTRFYRILKADTALTDVAASATAGAYTRADIFGSSSIQRSGSLTRGITFGSNRDAALESGLRLDLSGNLSEDIELLATLTDQSTPIQPDGSTQTLREFDQVYIRLRSKHGQLQMGDVDVMFDRSRFAQVNRRLQGADLVANTPVGYQRGTASVARGVYYSQTLQGLDGVQGPYRLAGSNGETFIVVLAGTENVYLDGRRLNRGEEKDYIIDYGLGEITFTNRRFITSKSRISVDFQYVSQQYTRTLLGAESQVSRLLGGRLDMRATVIREADGDNPNAQLLLSPREIDVLRRAGADPGRAVVSGVEPYAQSDGDQRIQYVRVDTLVNGKNVAYYRVDPRSQARTYTIRFSRTATGDGSYVRSASTINGFVFQWVGQGRGDYDTLRTLEAPIQKMVASLDLNYRLNARNEIVAEVAGSRFDPNRFSNDNGRMAPGSALFVGFKGGVEAARPNGFRYDLMHTVLSEQFAFFDRPREVEFDRIWNISDGSQTKEQRSILNLAWRASPNSEVSTSAGLLRRDRVASDRLQATFRSDEPRLPKLDYSWSYVQSDDRLSMVSGSWQKHGAQTSKPLSLGSMVIIPGMSVEHERRDQRNLATDSLSPTSLQFADWGPSLAFRDVSQRWGFRVAGSVRTDDLPLVGVLSRESRSVTRSAGWHYDAGRRFSTEQEVGIRQVSYTGEFKAAQGREDNRSALVRSMVRYALAGRLLEGQWSYDLRSERRARLQERYFEVGPDLGSYYWDDLNGNGIQEMDEFFRERIPGEGTFMLQFVPGDQFIPVTSLESSLRHVLKFSELKWLAEKAEWSRRLELSSRLMVAESSTDRIRNLIALQLETFQGDETQQGRISSTHELRLDQSDHGFGFRIIHDFSTSANRQVQGLESQLRNAAKATLLVKFNERWSSDWQISSEIHKNENEWLTSRGYDIRSLELRPILYANLSRRFVGSLTTAFIRRQDRLPMQPVQLQTWSADVEGTLFHGRGARTRVALGRRLNQLKGVASAYSLYELTDGGSEGVVWSASLQSDYRMSDFIRASLNYDMRKFPSRPMLQTMRFVVSASL